MRGTKGTVGSMKEVSKSGASARVTTGKPLKETGRTASHKVTGSAAKSTARKGGTGK